MEGKLSHAKTSNGLSVLVWPMAETMTVRITLAIKAGSRCETHETSGIAHFLEHLAFRGGKKYRTELATSQAIEGCGGAYNAGTGKELMVFRIDVPSDKLEIALDVLSDMVIYARLGSEEIEPERGPVLDELAGFQDMYDACAEQLFSELMFGDTPLGWDTGGNVENIRRFQRRDLIGFRKQFFNARQSILSVAGAVDPKEVFVLAENYFKDMPSWEISSEHPWESATFRSEPKVASLIKPSAVQTYLLLGVPAPSRLDARYAACKLLSEIVGGGMSSRLFINVRSRQGLVYDVYADYDAGPDYGNFIVGAAVSDAHLVVAAKTIMAECRRIASRSPSQKEVERAKKYRMGSAAMSFERPDIVSACLGTFALLFGDMRSPLDFVNELNAVTPQEVRDVARELFRKDEFRLVAVGPRAYSHEELISMLE